MQRNEQFPTVKVKIMLIKKLKYRENNPESCQLKHSIDKLYFALNM